MTQDLTRSEITKMAITELTVRRARVRQVHNIPFRRKKNHVEPGWPDIQGYSAQGVAILCEVKTKNDSLSDEQTARLDDAKKCNCICIIATVNKNGSFELIEYKPDLKRYQIREALLNRPSTKNDPYDTCGEAVRSGLASLK